MSEPGQKRANRYGSATGEGRQPGDGRESSAVAIRRRQQRQARLRCAEADGRLVRRRVRRPKPREPIQTRKRADRLRSSTKLAK